MKEQDDKLKADDLREQGKFMSECLKESMGTSTASIMDAAGLTPKETKHAEMERMMAHQQAAIDELRLQLWRPPTPPRGLGQGTPSPPGSRLGGGSPARASSAASPSPRPNVRQAILQQPHIQQAILQQPNMILAAELAKRLKAGGRTAIPDVQAEVAAGRMAQEIGDLFVSYLPPTAPPAGSAPAGTPTGQRQTPHRDPPAAAETTPAPDAGGAVAVISKDRLRWLKAELGGKIVFPYGTRKAVVDTLRDVRKTRSVEIAINKFLATYAGKTVPRAVESQHERLHHGPHLSGLRPRCR